MIKEQSQLTHDWWLKLRPLWKKFARETRLSGYDQEDIEQECYLQLINALEKFDEGLHVPFESYYKIQLYGWRANQNRKKREVLAPTDEELTAAQKDERVDIEKEVEQHLLYQEILKYLAALQEIERDLIIAYYIQNKKLSQIAKELGIKYKTAEFKKGEAVKKLRKYMKG